MMFMTKVWLLYFQPVTMLQLQARALQRVTAQLGTLHSRSLATSTVCLKNIRAVTPKVTNNRSKPLTYEEANYPYTIGVKKSWNSWNTSKLVLHVLCPLQGI